MNSHLATFSAEADSKYLLIKASEDFKTRFNNNPARTALRIDTISSQEAARMLREEQTDSDSDFADVAPWR
ncbi:hypothetical protein [Janthinobacterium agaricidamnosum]|uniref:Uncharacterized protein n=1 Tax=Janthinobacterium agaricidamnosum NBRC 102515 = DSM 9628 TaxID=1349767 RepID=W0V3X4_9BURK|nr:hypothetical protein [Janthinobacterium agaricidamnosum]CDG82315.1 hypothetical protein GJA_1677 [Janthinobacterium agaricidamnosum NBRC 102515 = DSM 9628]